MSTALATIDKITAAELFKPGASKTIIDKVEEEARELAATFDVSTPAGEDGLRTLAAHLGRTKQKIDKARIELVSDEKKRLKVIDAEGGVIWDRMEALQKEVRQPLTDKEDAERLAAAQAKAKADMEAATARAEQERKDAELRAEAARQAAIMVAESNAKKAAEKAEADRLAAVEAERQRAADEQRKAQEEATKRENNRKHAAKINGEVRDAIIKAASDASIVELTEIQATAVVVALAKGLIPHTKISY